MKEISKVLWVNENDQELGLVERTKAHKEGLLHRIAVIYVTRDNGQILVQERMSGRLDHSSAGHVDPGETYLEAAKRELKEELSIEAPLASLGKAIADEIEPEGEHYRIRHIFETFECRAEPGALAKAEVKSVFWADPKALYREMQDDPRNLKFCGGFKVSLAHFLKHKGLR